MAYDRFQFKKRIITSASTSDADKPGDQLRPHLFNQKGAQLVEASCSVSDFGSDEGILRSHCEAALGAVIATSSYEISSYGY